MTADRPLNSRERGYLDVLRDRLIFINGRIRSADASHNLDWRRHEAAALRWAIHELEARENA